MARREKSATKRLKIPERYQLVRLADHEFRLASLKHSLRIKPQPGAEKLLESVLLLLQEGHTLPEILESVGRSKRPVARKMVADFVSQGLAVESEPRKMADITEQEQERYEDQLTFFSNFLPVDELSLDGTPGRSTDIPAALQMKLKTATVMILGLGRTGSRLAKSLASSGVGTIIGSDRAPISSMDLQDSAFVPSDLGKPREEAIARIVEQANPWVNYRAFERDIPAKEDAGELPADVTLLVLCEDGSGLEHYLEINRLCLAAGLNWTSSRTYRFALEVGPTVVPGETACYRCYTLRRLSHLPSYEDDLSAEGHLSLGRLNIALGVEFLSLEVIKIITNFSRPMTYGSVLCFDFTTVQAATRPVLKVPRCPDCSPLSNERPTASIWQPSDGLNSA